MIIDGKCKLVVLPTRASSRIKSVHLEILTRVSRKTSFFHLLGNNNVAYDIVPIVRRTIGRWNQNVLVIA